MSHQCYTCTCVPTLDAFLLEIQDCEWFLKNTEKLVTEELELTDSPPLHPYFVDFLRDAPEATGEETVDDDMEDPKIYEQVLHTYIHTYHIMSGFNCVV